MKKYKTTKILAAITIIAGLLVIYGWLLDITILKSVRADWISMKTTTALCFVLSGILLFILAEYRSGLKYIDTSVAHIIAGGIIFIMGLFLLAAIFGFQVGLENFLITEQAGTVKTVMPGMPSISTMIAFLIFAIGAAITIRKPRANVMRTAGWLIAIIGGIAIIGYLTNLPALYYYIENVHTPIAFNTAVLFVLMGIGLTKLAK